MFILYYCTFNTMFLQKMLKKTNGIVILTVSFWNVLRT